MTSSGTSITVETCSTSTSYTTTAGTAGTTSLRHKRNPGYPFINNTVIEVPMVRCDYCKTHLRGRGGSMCRPCIDLVDHKILKYDILTGKYYKGKTRKMPQPHTSKEYTITVTGTTIFT